MGKIVFAGAMSHVLDPDYYQRACGDEGRQKVTACMAEIARMGERFTATRPDALIVVADDHLNAFSFNAVPALCVRIGRTVQRMKQDHAEAFDAVLDHMPEHYPLHEDLANQILERGLASGFDLALSWEAPVDHAFLSPVNTMHGTRPIPPLVPIWVNCFVAPQPTPKRCFDFGRHIARVVAAGPWNVGIIATGGLSHFPELSLPRVGETDTVFDRRLIHWMERGEHEPLQELTIGELHKTGEHEFLNWMVLLGAVSPARAQVRYFGELRRAARRGQPGARPGALLRRAAADQPGRGGVEPRMSRYAINSLLYRLKKDPEFRTRFDADPRAALADADLTEAERAAFVAHDMRRINELGGYLHLVMSIPGLAAH